MEVVAGVLPSIIRKLGELLVGEYSLQKEVKGGIIFLQAELRSIQGALVKISNTPADQLDNQDKIWARAVRELSYDIEDKIDIFMVHYKYRKQAKQHGLKKIVDKSLDLLIQPKIRRKIATDIRGIKSRVKEISERRDRYKVNTIDVPKPVPIDPRLIFQYEVTELIGIDQAREEVIKILTEYNQVSIVGIGGLGKSTLAKVVYEKLRAQFNCSAFVSVSQTPDMDKLFKDMFYQLAKTNNQSINVIDELREFLENKRYLVVIDDIWDITVWKMIKCSFPGNNAACKIITTTRILSVAEEAGDTYELKPLSLQNSRKLLYRRIFGNENRESNEEAQKCPNEELKEVSNEILKKCAGVPLAIITIASLLANKAETKMEWYEVYSSIGTGIENSPNAKDMRKILSYSYYDMPSHLRTCLLYVSTFPEDFVIAKDCLIWLWIAEGFIQCEEKGKSLFVLGESYFNELLNRSMIQPVYFHNPNNTQIDGCRVHDMVLDLLRSLSYEENFVTILSDTGQTYPSTAVRRMSLQNGKVNHASTQGSRTMAQVRSAVVFPSFNDQMPALRSFRVLRVLHLEDCDLSQGYYSFKYLENLFHLRYLNLKNTWFDQLPEEIGNLQFLQALIIKSTNISCLPLTVAKLKHLMCLSFDWHTRVLSNVLWNLRSLEELSSLRIDDESTEHIEGLSLLTELRVLKIRLLTDEWNSKLVESLCKLQKIQFLTITKRYSDVRNMGGMDAWVAPRYLRMLRTVPGCWFSRLPVWMNNPSQLRDLSCLYIGVREVNQEDLQILGRLPALQSLELEVDHEDLGIVGRFVVSAGSFPCLVRCKLWGFVVPVMFQIGAMPRLTTLKFVFHVLAVREITRRGCGFHLGLGNLPSLQYVKVLFAPIGGPSEELQEAKAAMTHAATIHPNRPTIQTW